MAGEKVLVVDDEPEIQELIGLYLRNDGFSVINCDQGDKVVDIVRREQPDLIILDVLLPGMDGIEICQEVRKETNVPIIFLSCKSEDVDKILGLRVGGDDYMTKPFNPAELLARVKAQLRRSRILNEHKLKKNILKFPEMTIDLNSREVWVEGRLVPLSAKEFEILVLFAQNPNRVFTYNQILRMVWNCEILEHDYRTVMVHVSNLRKKIESNPQNPSYILTVRGVGYKFGKTAL